MKTYQTGLKVKEVSHNQIKTTIEDRTLELDQMVIPSSEIKMVDS